MKNNRVFITHYSSASSLGVDAKSIVHALDSENPSPVKPGDGSIYLKPYYKIPYGYEEYAGATRGASIVFKLIDDVADFFATNKKVPFFMSTSTGGIDGTEAVYKDLKDGVSDYSIFENHFFNKIPDDIRAKYGDIIGESVTFSTACSSSGHAVLHAYRLIKAGIIKCAAVVGIDVMSRTTMVGFDSLQLVSSSVGKPLTNGRDGLTLGEGAGILILQSTPENNAVFEVVGAASSSDGHHISSPDPEGTGQKSCINRALSEAGITNGQIDYVSSHGTGTVMNDQVEIKVLKEMFGSVPVTSLKSYIGHTLGASTIDEIAICIEMMKNNKIYQPRNFADRMDDMIPEKTIDLKVNYFLKNSFGFGGNNVSLVIKNNS